MGFPLGFDLGGVKDKSLSKLLLSSARQYLHEFGEVLDLAVDTASRSIRVELLPVGEDKPIEVELSGYGLATDGDGRGWLSFETLAISRQWLTLLAERLLPDKRLPLPSGTPMGLLQTLL